MYVCVCVCMYVCVYVCIDVCMYVCIDVCMYVCIDVCMYVYMYVCMYVCVYRCMYIYTYILVDIRKEMFYLTTHSTHFIYGYMASDMVKDHSDSERGNPLPLSD